MDSWLLGAMVVVIIILSGGAAIGAMSFSAAVFALVFLVATGAQIYGGVTGSHHQDDEGEQSDKCPRPRDPEDRLHR